MASFDDPFSQPEGAPAYIHHRGPPHPTQEHHRPPEPRAPPRPQIAGPRAPTEGDLPPGNTQQADDAGDFLRTLDDQWPVPDTFTGGLYGAITVLLMAGVGPGAAQLFRNLCNFQITGTAVLGLFSLQSHLTGRRTLGANSAQHYYNTAAVVLMILAGLAAAGKAVRYVLFAAWTVLGLPFGTSHAGNLYDGAGQNERWA